MSNDELYETPYVEREYTSETLLRLWGPRVGWSTCRVVWHAIATAEHKCGLPISHEQLDALFAHINITPEELDRAREIERVKRHDLVAHKDAYGETCLEARKIIHLGSTSCDITDNKDLIILKIAIGITRSKLKHIVESLIEIARLHASLPILGRSHFMPGAPTTLGCRIAMWTEPLADSLAQLLQLEKEMPLRGLKGAMGTMDSYAALLRSQGAAVDAIALEHTFCEALNYPGNRVFLATGQTYPRTFDVTVLSPIAVLAAHCAKIANDLQLMAGLGEWSPPFASGQTGSSAMPHKRNPNLEERLISLARMVKGHLMTALETAATQKLERSIDDSAARRMYLPESFFAIDSCLNLIHHVFAHGEFNAVSIEKNLDAHLALASTDKIVNALAQSMDRQEAYALTYEYAQRVQSGELTSAQMIALMRQNRAFAPALSLLTTMHTDHNLVPMGYKIVDRLATQKVYPLLVEAQKALDMGTDGIPTPVPF